MEIRVRKRDEEPGDESDVLGDSSDEVPRMKVRRRPEPPGLVPLDEEELLREERARLGSDRLPAGDEPEPLELAADPDAGLRAAGSRFCKTCSSWRAGRVCPLCRIDLETGDPVEAPTAEDLGEPVRRDASGRLVLPDAPSHRQWLRVGMEEALKSLPGASLCFLLSSLALTFREIPLVGAPFPWPGRLLAGFVGTVWLVERARAARARTVDLDFVEMGGVLLRAAFLFPLLAGLASGDALYVTIPVAVLLAPIFPLVLGALVTETPVRELGPKDLFAAWCATAGYFRTALWFTVTLGLAIAAVGWDAGNPWLRGAVAALGATVAGTLAGQARRSAEHVPDV